MIQTGCPFSSNPFHEEAGTGGPPDGTFKNLVNGRVENRFNGGNIRDGARVHAGVEASRSHGPPVARVLPYRRILDQNLQRAGHAFDGEHRPTLLGRLAILHERRPQ